MKTQLKLACGLVWACSACAAEPAVHSDDEMAGGAYETDGQILASVKLAEPGHRIDFVGSTTQAGLISLVEVGAESHSFMLALDEVSEQLEATPDLVDRYRLLAGDEPSATERAALTAANARHQERLAELATVEPPQAELPDGVNKEITHQSFPLGGTPGLDTVSGVRNYHREYFALSPTFDAHHLLMNVSSSDPRHNSQPGLGSALWCTPWIGDTFGFGSSILAWTNPLRNRRSNWSHRLYQWDGSAWVQQLGVRVGRTGGPMSNAVSLIWTDFKWSKGCIRRGFNPTPADFANFYHF